MRVQSMAGSYETCTIADQALQRRQVGRSPFFRWQSPGWRKNFYIAKGLCYGQKPAKSPGNRQPERKKYVISS